MELCNNLDDNLSLDELRGLIHPLLIKSAARNLNISQENLTLDENAQLIYLIDKYKSKNGDIYFFLTGPGAPINFLSEYDDYFDLRELEIIIKPYIEKKYLTGGEEKIRNKYLWLYQKRGGNLGEFI